MISLGLVRPCSLSSIDNSMQRTPGIQLARLACSAGSMSRSSSSMLRMASTLPPPPPKNQPQPVTFAAKSTPRKPLHEAPETARGLPPSSPKGLPLSSSGNINAAAAQAAAFDGPSRPRMVYQRNEGRELPRLKNRAPWFIALTVLGLGSWGLFLLHATNSERLSSSVLRQVTFQLRNSPQLAAVLGDRVHFEQNWWGFGDPWISGTINMMQGRVDLKFRIKGSKDAGTVYFTSLRPKQEGAFQVVRYKVIADSGAVVQLLE